MNIAVINLAAGGIRWAAVRAEFAAVGLQPLRQEAVDGAALSPERAAQLYSPALNRRQYHRPLCDGEIGCYASHLAVWRRLLASDAAAIAVFEDDVELAPSLPRVLDAIERSPVDWDLVKLIGRPVEGVDARWPLLRDHTLISYRRVPSLTGAYVLTRRGAEKLLARRQPFGRPVDVDLRYWWECDLRIHGVQPYPVRASASSSTSTIDGRNFAGGLATRLRKLAGQANYSWLNRQALRARAASQPDDEAAPPVRAPSATRSHEPA